MKLAIFIAVSILTTNLDLAAQVAAEDTVYVLIDESDALTKKKKIGSSSTGFSLAYWLYDPEETKKLNQYISEVGLPPAGACDYYYFSSYDTGRVVDAHYLDDKIVYSREDLIKNGIHTDYFSSVEKEPAGFRIRKLYFSACE